MGPGFPTVDISSPHTAWLETRVEVLEQAIEDHERGVIDNDELYAVCNGGRVTIYGE